MRQFALFACAALGLAVDGEVARASGGGSPAGVPAPAPGGKTKEEAE